MSRDTVNEILESETGAFRNACRQWYVDGTTELGLPVKVEEAAMLVGSSPAKTYTQLSLAAFETHQSVLIGGKGSHLSKAIAVAEQVKQTTKARFVQFNKASLHSSLINPAYKPSASLKNIEVFLRDGESTQEDLATQSSQPSTNDVLREIKGHKVYKVPSIAILLVKDTQVAEEKLLGWTRQCHR
ncbi:hypothetical protein METBIDRAFT_176310 [Metschnikowia bicuspidata var. bicuspidata NRRL YB-4993]|uniref:DNA/RNA-binding protein Alba-like domain-containing protein n=1 Tax=Metschnikowia bicuspidata var. bicuspidata NRRL YB-4993 TaxID=869754 RepID=A0A1A0HAY9_9ASCO|nr:hypothetical protein METBIDRAFT_176310 [Metschnikowia bicuspidata var. bicuspidata NRRL YB-4993]OBA21160.1 hypothetical protein METBIDRAFT_176310 [Metschnikowia bicuspidata var. bicuspidata NRRL YB-4993]